MKLKVIGVKLSPKQEKQLQSATDKLGMSKFQARRFAIKLLCEHAGIEWIDDVPEHGHGLNKPILTNIDETLDKG